MGDDQKHIHYKGTRALEMGGAVGGTEGSAVRNIEERAGSRDHLGRGSAGVPARPPLRDRAGIPGRFRKAAAALAMALIPGLLTGIGVSSPLLAQTPETILRGVVMDRETDDPVLGAQVVVRHRQGTVIRAGYSGTDGAFVFTGIAPGVYSVTAGRIGFAEEVRTEVRIVEGREIPVDFRLRSVGIMTDAVVVTAGRRIERIADSDVSVAVVGRERIQEAREPTIFGVLARIGGLDFFEAGLGHQQVSARGFVNPFSTNMLILIDHRLAALPGLGTLLPGMVTAAQEEMERVEVVTGPSSALYGPNAGNGVVNISLVSTPSSELIPTPSRTNPTSICVIGLLAESSTSNPPRGNGSYTPEGLPRRTTSISPS